MFDKCSFLGRSAFFAALCATTFAPSALLADKTTNTYIRAKSDASPIAWSTAGLPSAVTTTDGSDISIKIEYAQDGEKYQQLKTPTPGKNENIYLDSVIGGKYHNFTFVNRDNTGSRYVNINDPTPFEGFWSIADGPARASGIFLPDNGGAGPRTIGSAFLKGRFHFGVAAGCEAVVDYPFGIGMFEINRNMNSRAPSGKITVKRSPGPYSAVQVRAGTLEIVGGDNDTSSPVPGAWARFDASAEGSFTMNGSEITEWRDADGRPVSAALESGLNKPTRGTDEVTGKTLVNFGKRGGVSTPGAGSRLKFAETKDGISEIFVVLRENDASKLPAHLFGAAFPRQDSASSSNTLFKAWGSLPKELAMGEFRLNGQAVVPDFAYNFSRELNVVSAGYRSGGGSVTFIGGTDSGTSASAGGAQIAEIIFYTNTLTAAQRRHNNEYLMRKWLGVGVRDYGAIMLSSGAALSVESGTVRVRQLQLTTNGFVKVGSGNLAVESLNTNLNSLVVNGGAVRFESTLERGNNPQPAADPFAWFDANESTSFETFTSNYTGNAGTLAPTNYTFITRWNDKRSNGYSLARVKLSSNSHYANGADEAAYPTLDSETGAHPMVDLGPWAQPASGNYGWIAGSSGLSTYLGLCKNGSLDGNSGARQGFVVFYKTSSSGNPINNAGSEIRNAGGTSPSSCFVQDNYASAAALGGHWTYDGKTVNPASVALPADKKTHLGSFLFADAAVHVNLFGGEYNKWGVDGNSSGGCKIAEVILYDRVLTEQERLDTERYLMAKWNCGTHPADRSISSVGTLSLGDGVESVLDNEVDMTYGKLVREDDGAVVKKGGGAATVQLFDPTATDVTAVTVEGGSLSLWCDPLVDAWTHLDAMREGSVVCETVNGTNFVTRWKDISGHGNDATNPAASVSPKEKPVYRTVNLYGDNILADSGREIPVIDFGEYYNCEQLPGGGPTYPTNTASGLTFPDKYAWLQEFYIVHADTDYWPGDGAGHNNNYCGILGFCGSGGPDGSQFPFLRSSQSPVIGDNGNGLIRGGYIGVNNEQKNASYSPTLKQLNVYTVSAAGQVSNKWCLAHRGWNQWGGQVLGEVILFKEANSEARRSAITAMLCNKWRAQGEPVVSSWTLGSVTVADGATLNVGGSKGFAYTAGTLGGLGTITSGPEILGVENVVVGAEGEAGTLAVTSDVTLADGTFIDVYADAEGHVSSVAMTGKLTIGGSGTVRLHVPANTEIPYGEYPIATATSIAVTGNAPVWTVQAPGLVHGKAKAFIDFSGNRVVLKVYPTGLSLLFR